MILKIEEYDMIVPEVNKLELRGITDPWVGEDDTLMIKIAYNLFKKNGDIAWSRNLDIPLDIYLIGNKFIAGKHTQTDVNKINTFFSAIGAPEIKVLKNQTEEVEQTPIEE